MLIIEDVVLTGDSLEKELELVKNVFIIQTILRAATVFVPTVAAYSNKKPDYYWY